MRRVQVCLAVVVLLTATPLFAQSKAKVQNVPEIFAYVRARIDRAPSKV